MKLSTDTYSIQTHYPSDKSIKSIKDREREKAAATKTYSVRAASDTARPIKPIKMEIDANKLKRFPKK